MTPTEAILQRCREVGFARAGVCAALPSAHREHVLRWLESGRHGEMSYLEARVELRLDPQALVPGARSIVCVADRYGDGARDLLGRPLFGRIARYCRGTDYHLVLRERLEIVRDECRQRWPEHRFRACVDTAPLLEREHAARAGLGAVGKHTLLIEPGVGSWLLLGAIVSTMPLEETVAARLDGAGDAPPASNAEGCADATAGGAGAAALGQATAGDPCGGCTRCIDACPTRCIEPFSINARECVSYLTLEHRGEIPEAFHAPMGDWLAGCDVCQEVCPHSQPTRRAKRAGTHAAYRATRDGLEVLAILDWTESDRRAAVAGTALERVLLPMLKRNAAIVAVNTCPPARRDEVRARLQRLAQDPGQEPVVRAAAAAGVRRLLRVAQDAAPSVDESVG